MTQQQTIKELINHLEQQQQQIKELQDAIKTLRQTVQQLIEVTKPTQPKPEQSTIKISQAQNEAQKIHLQPKPEPTQQPKQETKHLETPQLKIEQTGQPKNKTNSISIYSDSNISSSFC
ncbi:hypothetical protein FDP41_000260 [Naegleria fowleri]|uniref:Uncharacterized protein n=1 Tax=Naegleria fowleri TaxID=5763 RepID=A0A6A5CD02_NAEFO|nr:uncharacterized protein FDP41_010524 [Naegleria fowleri]XP_044569934.1 uncharacterized protein FDP41_000260 [Naegleria fowleri]KAF0983459.1 hypothetical protein FDP41_010524 [Naegleria fowleri]KAF0985221.1 hypothetical protein FDP41_000260 [Naegleria fowleri]